MKVRTGLLYSDETNLGNYAISVTNASIPAIDGYIYKRAVNHINKLTDCFYLGVSAGIRTPAFFSVGISYDSSSNEWAVNNNITDTTGFIYGISTTVSGVYLDSIDVTHVPELFSYSDQTPTIIVTNNDTGTADPYFYIHNGYEYVDSSYYVSHIGVFKVDSSSLSKFVLDGTHTGISGMGVYYEGLYQSNVDYTDRLFYTSGIPYLEVSHVYSNIGTLRVTGSSFTDYAVDVTYVPWPCKMQLRAQAWSGDCTTGTGTGSYVYSDWEPNFVDTNHSVTVYSLGENALYKLWYRLDARIGKDLDTWAPIGCYYTKSSGETDDDLPVFSG